MMSITRRTVSFLASFALLLFTDTSAQSCTNFTQLDISRFLDNFTTIAIGLDCPESLPAVNGSLVTIPANNLHWHITPGGNLSISCYPKGLITASVDNDVLSFAYGKAVPWQGGLAGVEIIAPAGNLTKIAAKGVGNSVEIMDTTGSIQNLEDRGANNVYYVVSTSNIFYASDSTSGSAYIQAPTAKVAMGGTDGKVSVKGNVNADMRGVRNKLFVQGNLTSATAVGVGSEISASEGSCATLNDTAGVDTTCQVNTDVSVTVVDIDCLGSAGTATCNNDAGTSGAGPIMKSIVSTATGLVIACSVLLLSL